MTLQNCWKVEQWTPLQLVIKIRSGIFFLEIIFILFINYRKYMGKSRFWRSELWENYVFLGRSKNHIFEVGIMGKPKITFFEVGRRCFLKVIIIGRSCGEKGRSFKMGSLNIPIYH